MLMYKYILFCACTLLSHFSLLIQGTDDPDRDWRGLMIRYYLRMQLNHTLFVDGVPMTFLSASDDIKVNDIKVSTHLSYTF